MKKLPRHRHQCGDVGGPWKAPIIDLSKGCGLIFEHAARGKSGSPAYEKRHMCPECGRGPWKTWLDFQAVS